MRHSIIKTPKHCVNYVETANVTPDTNGTWDPWVVSDKSHRVCLSHRMTRDANVLPPSIVDACQCQQAWQVVQFADLVNGIMFSCDVC